MNDLIAAIILGLLQGFIEWLPVSSQGNLVLLMILLLNLKPSEALNYSVYLHIGTGFAALIYFREKIKRITFRETDEDKILFNFLLVSTIITGLLGFPLFFFVKGTTYLGESLLALTGATLIFTGFLQRLVKERNLRSIDEASTIQGMILGGVQALAALPGLSRSGVTTSTLLFLGYEGETSLEISFLMSIPVVFTAGIGLIIVEGSSGLNYTLLIGIIASFLTAYISIEAFLGIARKVRFWKLCIGLGVIAILAFIPNII